MVTRKQLEKKIKLLDRELAAHIELIEVKKKPVLILKDKALHRKYKGRKKFSEVLKKLKDFAKDNKVEFILETSKRTGTSIRKNDKKRKALPPGRRITSHGTTYGTTYYENRKDRSDIKII